MKNLLKKIVLVAAVTLTTSYVSQAQLCNGTLGQPSFIDNFGSGTAVYGPALPTNVTTYPPQVGPSVYDNSYVIANTGNATGLTGYINAGDNTGNGYMMVVNGNPAASTVYRRRIENLCPNTNYVFTAWFANNNTTESTGNCGSAYTFPNLTMQVLDQNGGVIASIGTNNLPTAPTNAAFIWAQFGASFTTGQGAGFYDIVIISNGIGGCGNDFVIDDIAVAPCLPPVTISAVPNKTVFCIGEPLTLQTIPSGSFTNPQYQWQFSSNNGVTWTDIANATSPVLNIPSASLTQAGMYRLIVAGNGNIKSTNCRSISNVISISVKDCGCCIGNICSSTTKNPLPTSWEVPLGNNNYIFSKGTSNIGKVGVGVVSCVPGNLLEVNNGTSGNMSGLRLTDLAASPLPAANRVLSVDNNGDVILVVASGQGGVNGCATTNYVPKTNALGNSVCSQIFDDGVSVGVGTNSGFFYSSLPAVVVQSGINAPSTQGFLRLNVNGVTQSQAYFAISDQKFKKNIQKIDGALELIKKIDGKTYFWRVDEYKDNNFSTGRQYGFIAQELERVVPEAVAIKENGERSVNYDMMIPILVESIKEQATVIDNLQKQIDELKANSQTGNKTNTSNTPSQNVSLSDKNVILLDQNIPNPFFESTVIHYFISGEFTKAQINFLTNDGKLIKTVDITTKGQGSLTVFASDLSFGSYSYSLIVDGKIIDTKRMIKQ